MEQRTRDRELAGRLRAGDQQAFRSAVEAYSGAVRATARRIVVDEALAEDVAQETLLALWRRPQGYDPARGRLLDFLLGTARNKAIDAVRAEERRRRLTQRVEAAPETVDSSERVEERRRVLAALAHLSYVQREAIFLAFYQGMTYREVAATLGVPEGTIKTRIRDAMIRLRGTMSATSAA